MSFLLGTWHFRETDSFECVTMAVDFCVSKCGLFAKWAFEGRTRSNSVKQYMYADLLYKLLTTYLSVSFLFAELLHVCAFCARTAKFSTDPDLSAGGRGCRAVQQL